MKKDEGVVVEVLEVVVDVVEVPAQARDEQRSTTPRTGWSPSYDGGWERTFGKRQELN